MATYPAIPKPQNIDSANWDDDVLSISYDAGYESSRSRYPRSKYIFTLHYAGLTQSDKNILLRFIRDEIRNSALDFDFIYPFPQPIVGVSNTTPIILTTVYPHWFKTNDTVVITGNGAVGGPWLITYISPTTFSLQTSGAVGAANGGTIQLQLPKAKIVNENLTQLFETMYGADINNYGRYTATITIQEKF